MNGPAAAPEFLSAAGRRLAVRRIGHWRSGDAVLVFLHEGLGSISMWRDFPDALSRACGLPALVYERAGHGRSEPASVPRPADFLDVEARRVLPALLAEAGIERPLLFGHSDGGTIALMFSAAFPSAPVACVVEAAHVMMEARTRGGVSGVAERWRDDARFRRRLARHHDDADALVAGWAGAWLSSAGQSWSMVDDLPGIVCPVLAFQGEDDQHGTTAQIDEIVRRISGPARRALLPGCGHVPHLEDPDAVLRLVAPFVAGVRDADA